MYNTRKNHYRTPTAELFVRTECNKVFRFETLIGHSLDEGRALDLSFLIDYARAINSYCDALDLFDNYDSEREEYEKALRILSQYGDSHPEQFNIRMTTFIKYAEVLCKQGNFKESCHVLKEAISYMMNNINALTSKTIDTRFLLQQIHP